jgi:hypothetical protein
VLGWIFQNGAVRPSSRNEITVPIQLASEQRGMAEA